MKKQPVVLSNAELEKMKKLWFRKGVETMRLGLTNELRSMVERYENVPCVDRIEQVKYANRELAVEECLSVVRSMRVEAKL